MLKCRPKSGGTLDGRNEIFENKTCSKKRISVFKEKLKIYEGGTDTNLGIYWDSQYKSICNQVKLLITYVNDL